MKVKYIGQNGIYKLKNGDIYDATYFPECNGYTIQNFDFDGRNRDFLYPRKVFAIVTKKGYSHWFSLYCLFDNTKNDIKKDK
jgi:hypothetical protein